VLLVTQLTPDARVADELAQRAVTSLWVVLGLVLLGAARRLRLPADVAAVCLRFGGGLLGAAAFKSALLDAPFFGPGGSALLGALVAALAIPLVLREARTDAWLAIPGVALAVPAQVVLLQLAPPHALAYGADRLALVGAAGLVAGAAALAVTLLIEQRLRLAGALAAQLVCLYAASVFLVSALTDHAGHTVHADQLAQVALSVLWTVWGIGMLAFGVRGTGALAVAHRRAGVVLTAIAAGKVLLLDTAHLDTGHRAGVFLAVGLVLLAGAYLYTKLTGGGRRNGDPEPAGA
jgi:uncharacterized membrane protein